MSQLPKTKKSLSKFLNSTTTKKIVGTAVVGGSIVAGNTVFAVSTYTKTETPALPYPSNAEVYHVPNHTNSASKDFVVVSGNTCSHASGIINGHYNYTPTVSPTTTIYKLTNTHGSHGSHGSHCNGCRTCSNW